MIIANSEVDRILLSRQECLCVQTVSPENLRLLSTFNYCSASNVSIPGTSIDDFRNNCRIYII